MCPSVGRCEAVAVALRQRRKTGKSSFPLCRGNTNACSASGRGRGSPSWSPPTSPGPRTRGAGWCLPRPRVSSWEIPRSTCRSSTEFASLEVSEAIPQHARSSGPRTGIPRPPLSIRDRTCRLNGSSGIISTGSRSSKAALEKANPHPFYRDAVEIIHQFLQQEAKNEGNDHGEKKIH